MVKQIKLMSSQKKISKLFLPNNYNPSDIKYKYHLKDLTAPVKKDQKQEQWMFTIEIQN